MSASSNQPTETMNYWWTFKLINNSLSLPSDTLDFHDFEIFYLYQRFVDDLLRVPQNGVRVQNIAHNTGHACLVFSLQKVCQYLHKVQPTLLLMNYLWGLKGRDL